MRPQFFAFLALASVTSGAAVAAPVVTETVYVETPLDTDLDGKQDRVYVEVTRPAGAAALPAIFAISPYAMGGNDAPNHEVDLPALPQDDGQVDAPSSARLKRRLHAAAEVRALRAEALDHGYASLSAHSLGTGNSTGCPSVGDMTETTAAKAVIDWLNGRARAFGADGHEVKASWANGAVGMTGVSYNGTLPNMVAATGVDGLKAIIPISAISSWYDYYRANGLVVSPGGYAGEDADVLGQFIVRAGACAAAITQITQAMGREHGDFSEFWRDRDYVAKAAAVRAAVFIIHGQADWNVKQRHAIRWWEALLGQVPLRMWLHRGGHGPTARADESAQKWAWFDRYVKGVDNGVENQPPVEVESPAGVWTTQAAWPQEETASRQFYLNADHSLAETPGAAGDETFVDAGRTKRLETLAANPAQSTGARLVFLGPKLAAPRLLSGTPKIQLNLAVVNRHAANITVALVEYDAAGRANIVTRGWADPQNHADIVHGESLVLGQTYQLAFDLEPKQYTFARGSRIGVVVAATDYDYTIRPDAGTEIAVALGAASFVTLNLARD